MVPALATQRGLRAALLSCRYLINRCTAAPHLTNGCVLLCAGESLAGRVYIAVDQVWAVPRVAEEIGRVLRVVVVANHLIHPPLVCHIHSVRVWRAKSLGSPLHTQMSRVLVLTMIAYRRLCPMFAVCPVAGAWLIVLSGSTASTIILRLS